MESHSFLGLVFLHVRAFFQKPTGKGFSARVLLAWGKVRRMYLATFFPGYVERMKAGAQGECARTGACCKLLYVCPHLDETGPEASCTIYEERPRNCRVFPIDWRDIRDRDLVSPGDRCGYSPPGAC